MWLWIGLLCLTMPNVDSIRKSQLEKATCSGTENGWNILQHSGTYIEYLKTLYDGCKIVVGNLEISYLSKNDLDKAGGEHALDFLSSIEQVYGYVLIVFNQITTISLPNLQIIWGDDYYMPNIDNGTTSIAQIGGRYGLFIMNNPNLEVLDLRSLRAVHQELIGLYLNPYICHWQSIDYRQILGENYLNRIKNVSNFNRCKEKELVYVLADGYTSEAHWTAEITRSVSCWSGCKKCFGPLESQCQQIYRDNCADQCPNQMCYNSSSLFSKCCCHAECAAGCFGPSDKECYGCVKLQNGKKCVDKCPPPEIYNSQTMQVQRMPEGKYAYRRLCVDHCPAHTVIYRDACVSRCPKGFFINDARICQECDGSCPKTCQIRETITGLNIRSFENCTDVEGFIHIGRLSFESKQSSKHYPTNEKRLEYKGITEDDLEMLSNVRSVSDYVMIESGPYITNLNFLRNLHKIEGRRPFRDKVSFQIFGNENLVYLGLVNLKQIINGEGWIKDNYNLCYVYDIPWNMEIAKRPAFVNYGTNCDPKLCNDSMHVCHSSCESSKGCWGPGPHMCYECKGWKLNNKNCVENCTVKAGFYESAPKVCSSCHHECLMCNGSSSFNCLRCRNVFFNGECVPFCPANDYYFNQTSKTCEKCHENCYQLGCTGPGNFVGNGGCKKCKYGIYDSVKKTVSPCLLEISSQEHCSNQKNYTNYFWALPRDPKYIKLVEYGVCAKCWNVCKRCSFYGNSLKYHGCICSSHRILSRDSLDDIVCNMKCPENYYSKVSAVDPEIVDCLPCDPQCEGCYGPSSFDCISCKHFRIELDKTNKYLFNCTQSCPKELKYADMKNCIDIDVMKYTKNEQRKINIFILVGISLALIAVFIVAFLLCHRTMMFTKLNIPDDCNETNLDAQPDLSQLRLITELEVKRGDVLGCGAFGTVFKGVWTAQGSPVVKKIPVAIKVLHEAKESTQQDMLEEATHMARVNHSCLLKLIGVCLGQQMMLITPLMPLGNLLNYVQQNRAKIGSSALLRWCLQIASGMAHLEELRLVHRDLAARNVLVQNPYQIRITDFGLAKMLDYGEQELKIVKGIVPFNWLALECIQYCRYTHKSDVWAYGVTVWELLTFGDKPYKDVPLMQIQNFLEKGYRLPQPKICTLDVYTILVKCWMVPADSRPSFKELHEIFNKMLENPGRYLVIEGDKLLRLPLYSTQDRRDMVRELIDDPDVVDLEECSGALALSSLPTSPVTTNKPLLSETEVLPRNDLHRQSTTSHEYKGIKISIEENEKKHIY